VEFRAPLGMFLADFDWQLIRAVEQYRQTDFAFLTLAPGDEKEATLLLQAKERGREYSQARHHIALAYEHLSRKDAQAAAEELLAAAALNPYDVLLVELNANKRRQAYALAQAGDTQAAIERYRSMVAYAPGDTDARYNLGMLLMQQGSLTEAYQHLLAASLLEPEDLAVHLNSARVAGQLGLYPAAVQHYRDALTIAPESVPALTSLAIILSSASDPALRNLPEAVVLAERARSLSPGTPAVYQSLGMAYKASQRTADARQSFETGLKLAEASGDDRMKAALQAQLAALDAPR